jgi:glyoxylase-like metal-dependent hydrolase (beta-lactamase superfamily II)
VAVIFKQFRYEPLGQASYLLGCARARQGVVVDPIDDLGAEFYVLEAADLGLDIVAVLETHVHADFISCARELAEMTGAPHRLHEAAYGLVTYPFEPLHDREAVRVGQVELQALHTPGHTPEHTAYLVRDHARSDEPWCVLTGDSLFVGDVGRPDLLIGDQAMDVMDEDERARSQFGSIHERLVSLPDHVEVFPNHYGGSTCGGVNMSGKASSTIGFERRHNLALQQPDAAAFAAFVRDSVRPFPDDYRSIKSCNLGLVAKEDVRGAMR